MVSVITARSQTTKKDKKLESLLLDFVNKKKMADELNDELKSLKEKLADFAIEEIQDTKTVSFILQNYGAGAKISFTDELVIKDIPKLKEALNTHFETFVSIKYSSKAGLMNLYADDKVIKECCELKQKTPTVALIKI